MEGFMKNLNFVLLCLSGVITLSMSQQQQGWGPWQDSDCSASCGPGTYTQTRQCLSGYTCTGVNMRRRRCSQICSGWGEWAPASRCSETCGRTGYRQERRVCMSNDGCAGVNTKFAICRSNDVCSVWGEWVNGTCSVTCGSGIRVDRRSCIIGNCVGSTQREVDCTAVQVSCEVPGVWSSWTTWTTCSVTCDSSGVRARSRICIGGSRCVGNSAEEQSCLETGSCLCSCPPVPSCENRLSQRFCLQVAQLCRNTAGIISACASTCNACEMCESCDLAAWSSWKRGECECSTRTRTDTRTCLNAENARNPCVGPSSRAGGCDATAYCPVWGPWRNGQCQVTCGAGTRIDRRTCMNGNATNTCVGSDTREMACDTEIPCGPSPCRDRDPTCSSFSAFCGNHQFESFLSSIPCYATCRNLCRGEWSTWTIGECSPGCGGIGVKTDRRTCIGDNCEGDSTRQVVCIQQTCTTSEYGPWLNNGPCSVTCGRGQIAQIRNCIRGSCPDTQRTAECVADVVNCGARLGNPWSPWGECSTNCGPGTQVKRRRCPRSVCPGGFSEIRRSCNNQNCQDVNTCSRECGNGTFYNSMTRRYSDCNNGPCPIQSCPPEWENRYKQPHECCDKSSAVPKSCGMATTARVLPRIIQGRNTTIMNWPWTVQLSLYGDFACGAILVSRNFVITAAHCVFNIAPEHVSMVMGATRLQDSIANRTASEIFVHERYNATGGLENDIAIIQLNKPIDLGVADVNSICLPEGEVVPIDLECVVAGWGRTSNSGPPTSENLQEASVRILPPDICRRAYRNFFDPSNRVCAGRVDGSVDTCTGDSGGPLMCQRCSSCAWMLVGVTSFGGVPCARANSPGVYTRVVAQEEWLRGIINDLPASPAIMPSCLQ